MTVDVAAAREEIAVDDAFFEAVLERVGASFRVSVTEIFVVASRTPMSAYSFFSPCNRARADVPRSARVRRGILRRVFNLDGYTPSADACCVDPARSPCTPSRSSESSSRRDPSLTRFVILPCISATKKNRRSGTHPAPTAFCRLLCAPPETSVQDFFQLPPDTLHRFVQCLSGVLRYCGTYVRASVGSPAM